MADLVQAPAEKMVVSGLTQAANQTKHRRRSIGCYKNLGGHDVATTYNNSGLDPEIKSGLGHFMIHSVRPTHYKANDNGITMDDVTATASFDLNLPLPQENVY
ncbi:hypothetical protein POM88_005142 [Heracleum sosnowskyi]|uniref:Uncharacterized protein n=1 Tax=Heracleum sosnowskyi TaxID=360622 RepID=A0AAD8JN46_9APIA|nr:hypothetical protein POM88_005142 [Heracleum sosnowskyi]